MRGPNENDLRHAAVQGKVPFKRDLPRLRIEYGKDDRLAFLGNLEVIGTVERCVRRAHLPFSIGNGFARRMRIQFSQALPVGASSRCEYYDVRLTERIEPERALAMIAAATPPALAPARAGYVDAPQGALEAWLTRARWDIEVVGCAASARDLSDAIAQLRDEGELTYLRGQKTKRVDLSRALVGCDVSRDGGALRMELDTRSSNEGSLRPAVLLDAALSRIEASGYDCLRVRRTGQWHEDESGCLVKPL